MCHKVHCVYLKFVAYSVGKNAYRTLYIHGETKVTFTEETKVTFTEETKVTFVEKTKVTFVEKTKVTFASLFIDSKYIMQP